MQQLRSPVILVAAPAGLVLGTLAWILLGGSRPATFPTPGPDGNRTSAKEVQKQAQLTAAYTVSQIMTTPLFVTNTPADAQPDVAVKVLGLSRTPAGSAALLSINNGPAEWLSIGTAKNGVTVQDVSASKVVLATPGGRREVELGDTAPPGQAPAAPRAVTGAFLRMPPPPASAPVARP